MKEFALLLLLSILVFPSNAQDNRVQVLQDLEYPSQLYHPETPTATLSAASRLFADKDDLTSVMLVIPKGATVNVLESIDDYFRVEYDGNEGYMYARHATMDTEPAKPQPDVKQSQPANQQPAGRPVQRESRFAYLQKKYGYETAARLYTGKVWKGMTGEMVRDSWGSPHKINRVISGNNIREEWIYKSSWLFIENDLLVDWGPTRR